MWFPFGSKPQTAPPPPAPSNSVSLDWFLGLTGPLVDGQKSSIRFRENVESPNIRLAELEAWAMQALTTPQTEQKVRALQDLVNSVAKRLDFGVHYGCYEENRSDWLHFDGLWQIDGDLFATAVVHSQRLEKIDFKALTAAREDLRDHQDWVSHAQLIHVCILADGVDPRVEGEIRRSHAHDQIRFLPLHTLFELVQLYEEGVISRRQLPMLFRPFSTLGIHDLLSMIEEFTALFEEPSGSFIPHPIQPVLTSDPITEDDRRGFDHVVQLFEAGRREEGEDSLALYLKHHPEELDALAFQAEIQLGAGRPDEALETLNRLASLRPKEEGPRMKQASLLLELNRPKEALEALEPLAHATSASSVLLCLRADCLRRDGRGQEAIDLCRRITGDEERRCDAWKLWLRCLIDEDRIEEARSVLERAAASVEDPDELKGLEKELAEEV